MKRNIEDYIWYIVGGVILILVIGFITPFFIKHDNKERVTAVSWYREVHVVEWKTVSRTGSYVPSRGRETSSWIETRKTCNGYKDGKCTGYTTHYDRKYRYDIEDWIFKIAYVTKGNDKNPYWFDATDLNWPADMNSPQIGNEKVSTTVESYTLYFTDKPHDFVTGFETWNKFDIEDLVTVTRNGYGYPVGVRSRE